MASDPLAQASAPPSDEEVVVEHCPICATSAASLFVARGSPPRPKARCSSCGARDRHRLAWTYLVSETDLLRGERTRLLHLAPEGAVRRRLERHDRVDYLSGDLDPTKAMARVDVTAIDQPAESFDAVYCSHVLEHVPDDRKAMSELHRVLRPGGWLLVMVPTRGDEIYEDWSITDPVGRERHFGQDNHVRWYGEQGLVERLEQAGFEVAVDRFARRRLGRRLAERLGTQLDEPIFMCRKPPGVASWRPPSTPPPARVRDDAWADLVVPPLGRWEPTQRLSVILVDAGDRSGDAAATLASLREQTYPRELVEVLVADPPAAAMEGQAHDGLEVRATPAAQDDGRAALDAARDAAARKARGQILVFLEGAPILDSTHLEAHARWHHLVSDAVTRSFPRRLDLSWVPDGEVSGAARGGALVELLGEHEVWSEGMLAPVGRMPERLPRRPGRAGSPERGDFAVRADSYAAARGRSTKGASDTTARLDAWGALFVPEREALAWRRDGEPRQPVRARPSGVPSEPATFEVTVAADWENPRAVVKTVKATLARAGDDATVMVAAADRRQRATLSRRLARSGARVVDEPPFGDGRSPSPLQVLLRPGVLPGEDTFPRLLRLLDARGLGSVRADLDAPPGEDRRAGKAVVEGVATRALVRAERVTQAYGGERDAVVRELFGTRKLTLDRLDIEVTAVGRRRHQKAG